MLRKFSIYFLLFALSFSSLLGTLVYMEYMQEKENIIKDSKHLIEQEEENLANHIQEIVIDLLYLSKLQFVVAFSDINNKFIENMEHEYLDFMTQQKIYDQIRFIDKSGMEIVRVNYNNGNPKIVEKEQLQSKEHRYYFKESFKLKKGEIYISAFDLNIEHNKVELPRSEERL